MIHVFVLEDLPNSSDFTSLGETQYAKLIPFGVINIIKYYATVLVQSNNCIHFLIGPRGIPYSGNTNKPRFFGAINHSTTFDIL